MNFCILLVLALFFLNCTVSQTSRTGTFVPAPADDTESELAGSSEIVQSSLEDKSVFNVSTYWVQILATHNLEKAETEAALIREQEKEPVRIIQEGGLYKIQVGEFANRKDAVDLQVRLNQKGWNDTWIVSYEIGRTIQRGANAVVGLKYYVQVLASENRGEARKLLRTLLNLGFKDAYIKFESNIWKVQLGTYSAMEEARVFEERIKRLGYPNTSILTTSE